MSNQNYPAMSEGLQQKLRRAGWKKDMRFDAVADCSLSLGGWLVKRFIIQDIELELIRECLREGLPFFFTSQKELLLPTHHLLGKALTVQFNQDLWEMFFEEGLDINQRLEDNNTLLMEHFQFLKKRSVQDDLFQFLWSKNPDLSLTNDARATLLLYVASNAPFDVPWLLERGANATDEILCPHTFTVQQNLISRVLVGLMTHPEASRSAIEDLLQACVDHGADIHALLEGETLLQQALVHCHQAIPFLLNKGVSLTHLNEAGQNFLESLQEQARFHQKQEDLFKTFNDYIDLTILKMKEPLNQALPTSLNKPNPLKRM